MIGNKRSWMCRAEIKKLLFYRGLVSWLDVKEPLSLETRVDISVDEVTCELYF